MTTPYGFRVDIVCSELSHEGRVAKVTNFTYIDIVAESDQDTDGYPLEPEWVHDLEARDPAGWTEACVLRYGQSAKLDDDLLAKHIDSGFTDLYPYGVPPPVKADIRIRYSLPCDLCSLNLTVRHEKLTPALDRLAEHNITAIELAHLAAILASVIEP